MNIQSLIEFLIAYGVIVPSIIYYLSKKTIDHSFKNKELEFDKQTRFLIENYKNTLHLFSYKENKLHDKRIEVIAELYGKLVSLQFEMNDLTRLLKYTTSNPELDEKTEKVKLELCTNLYNDFYIFYSMHKIYLSEKTCNPLDEIRNEYFNSLWDYSSSKKFIDYEYSFKLSRGASEKIRIKIPSILLIIENDFKTIIGSDN